MSAHDPHRMALRKYTVTACTRVRGKICSGEPGLHAIVFATIFKSSEAFEHSAACDVICPCLQPRFDPNKSNYTQVDRPIHCLPRMSGSVARSMRHSTWFAGTKWRKAQEDGERSAAKTQAWSVTSTYTHIFCSVILRYISSHTWAIHIK